MNNTIKKTLFYSLLTLILSCNSPSVKINNDTDGDEIINSLDNCPDTANKEQLDTDGDGKGNICDDDDDNDGIKDVDDNCPLMPNPDQKDTDGNGIGDVCDKYLNDTDKDGIKNDIDNCPNTANPDQKDTDGDGIGDVCDDSSIDNKVPCVSGMAGIYPCNGYDLLLHIPLSTFGATEGNDSWGWTDASTNKEYAIMCVNNGTVFVDITNTNNPVYLGKIPTATVNSSWRDVKIYKDHAFIVSEAYGHGMQVFDLTRLRNVSTPPETFSPDTHFKEFGSAHNMVINEESGYAYPVGTSKSGPYKGGPLFINIQDPKNPKTEGGWGTDNYSHDAQVINYNGPDSDYTGKEILIGSNENEVVIVDISDKSNPKNISKISYANVGYTHQGWFTENKKYFILGDELDEQKFGNKTRNIIFDFTDLDNPKEHFSYTGPTNAIDHNGYIKDNMFYLANYTAGVRFIDITNISSKSITETGYFDTYPNNNGANFNGVWNVYPYFDSGKIIISDINSGLFIVKKQ
ncbi:choice-of-anchor B family protein [Tenacibaculum pacificus]|uniref:choice-of-anchor B family protein n=1 Tax=Tenacibaculum pacificus TaxID=3018314 RepID=UPI0022F3FF0B|nr:choice-of-anchor B family protein [Tenacibaculum pacificus]WBX73918.1 choice-of-anchor B family protein [Tenacibaculum pacificus]